MRGNALRRLGWQTNWVKVEEVWSHSGSGAGLAVAPSMQMFGMADWHHVQHIHPGHVLVTDAML